MNKLEKNEKINFEKSITRLLFAYFIFYKMKKMEIYIKSKKISKGRN